MSIQMQPMAAGMVGVEQLRPANPPKGNLNERSVTKTRYGECACCCIKCADQVFCDTIGCYEDTICKCTDYFDWKCYETTCCCTKRENEPTIALLIVGIMVPILCPCTILPMFCCSNVGDSGGGRSKPNNDFSQRAVQTANYEYMQTIGTAGYDSGGGN